MTPLVTGDEVSDNGKQAVNENMKDDVKVDVRVARARSSHGKRLHAVPVRTILLSNRQFTPYRQFTIHP